MFKAFELLIVLSTNSTQATLPKSILEYFVYGSLVVAELFVEFAFVNYINQVMLIRILSGQKFHRLDSCNSPTFKVGMRTFRLEICVNYVTKFILLIKLCESFISLLYELLDVTWVNLKAMLAGVLIANLAATFTFCYLFHDPSALIQ